MSSPIVKGANEVIALLKGIAAKFPDKVAQALYMEAQIEMTEAKRRTPVDVTPPLLHPGLLRSTGRVHEPERHGRKISVTLSFGTDYAVYVHENLDAHHEVGQAKFLQSTLEESQPHMGARIAARIDLKKLGEEVKHGGGH